MNYIRPEQATRLRISDTGDMPSPYTMEGEDDDGNCTATFWTYDTEEEALLDVASFAEAFGLKTDLPVVIDPSTPEDEGIAARKFGALSGQITLPATIADR